MKRDGRRILFEGIRNCRDLGGIVNAEGKQIREGLLLRSAHLRNASPADVQELRDVFSLTEILDLRNVDEQRENTDQEVPGAVHVEMPVFPVRQEGITHEKNLRPYEIYPPMEEIYIKFIMEEPINRNMAQAVRRILTHDYDGGSILWHCFGGKDRCGMAAALTLSVLDVPYSTILEDYLLTNIEAKDAAERARKAVLERGGSQKEADFEYDGNIAKESFLNGAFAALREKYGNAAAFLKEAGGVTTEEILRFQEKVLFSS